MFQSSLKSLISLGPFWNKFWNRPLSSLRGCDRVGCIDDQSQAELLKQTKNSSELNCGLTAFDIASEYCADACKRSSIIKAKSLCLSCCSYYMP